MTAPADPREALAAIRERHRLQTDEERARWGAATWGENQCMSDGKPWPCDAAILLEALAARQDEPSPALRADLWLFVKSAALILHDLNRHRTDSTGGPAVPYETCVHPDCVMVRALAANPPQTREAEDRTCLTCGTDRDSAHHSVWASDAHEFAAQPPEAQRDAGNGIDAAWAEAVASLPPKWLGPCVTPYYPEGWEVHAYHQDVTPTSARGPRSSGAFYGATLTDALRAFALRATQPPAAGTE